MEGEQLEREGRDNENGLNQHIRITRSGRSAIQSDPYAIPNGFKLNQYQYDDKKQMKKKRRRRRRRRRKRRRKKPLLTPTPLAPVKNQLSTFQMDKRPEIHQRWCNQLCSADWWQIVIDFR